MRDLTFRFGALALACLLPMTPTLADAEGAAPPAPAAKATGASGQVSQLPSAKAYGDFSQARIEYGRYLTLAGDCLGCHVRPGGKAFEGGLALDTPFGTIYSPNITPHKGWGIGSFSDEDFLRALQHGIRPDGKPYYPALPYPSFTKVKDDDLLAIKDYLFSLEPSDYRPPETQLRWPFDKRDLLLGWQELYLSDKRFEPDLKKSDEWNRGAYLVEGLGHCGSCHTPRNLAGATKAREALTGAVIDGWYAPNLTSELGSGLGDWSIDDLVTYLRTGEATPASDPAGTSDGTSAKDGPQTAALGPMAEVVHLSLSQLADSDVRAMAVYLKDQPPKEAPRDTPKVPHQLSEQDYIEGRRLYQHYCSGCHQSHGQGLAPYFPSLRGNEVVLLPEPNDVIQTVLLGAPSDPTQAFSPHVVMPSFGSLLNDHQIAILASYIRANWGNDAAPVTPKQVSHLRQGD
ncbi:cytochrome c [Thiorhodovibrio frisius]|uniref:Cytochrome c, mono-and diheme variants family n=1 Tax=Thiorhodovibrio frisius TaxID=631362 RepID=H8Z146_9GAMM|nr:cytochrome c [Thiorhodovibrio frisius]EIC22467.1 cytochrome c, mono- and diheme variants family [Thiorhodovibrio frisius]WPL24768.1 Gluconate 2-dehydrogenase cytochrome c subunit precursor [Thiorhodovibrio frisius]